MKREITQKLIRIASRASLFLFSRRTLSFSARIKTIKITRRGHIHLLPWFLFDDIERIFDTWYKSFRRVTLLLSFLSCHRPTAGISFISWCDFWYSIILLSIRFQIFVHKFPPFLHKPSEMILFDLIHLNKNFQKPLYDSQRAIFASFHTILPGIQFLAFKALLFRPVALEIYYFDRNDTDTDYYECYMIQKKLIVSSSN